MVTALLTSPHRAPWWKWLLYSLGSSLGSSILVLVSILTLLLLYEVDFRDYLELRRPPYITSGVIAAWIALALAGQKLVALLAMRLFPPAGAVAFAGLRRPADPSGMWRRLGLGVLVVIAVQVLWTLVGADSPEQLRVVDHLVYAVVGGGRFWPAFWIVLAVGVVTPFAEEIGYRGFAFGMMRRRWPFWAAGLASAALFGLPHALPYNLANAIPTGALGFYLAYQTEKDGSLTGAILLHALNNLGALIWLSFTV